MSDPVTGQRRSFNDLARREADLSSLLCVATGTFAGPLAAAAAPPDIGVGIGRVH
jgi:hypothetical protein